MFEIDKKTIDNLNALIREGVFSNVKAGAVMDIVSSLNSLSAVCDVVPEDKS